MSRDDDQAADVVDPSPEIPELLDGQRALVTGGSSGIGKGISLALAAAGADVAVNYHSDEETAREVADRIEDAGREAVVHGADVSQEDAVEQMFEHVCEAFGTIDILVNNAGIQQDAAFREMTLDQWQNVLDVNLTGQFLCAREAVREFCRRGVDEEISQAAGKIICISSVHERIPWGGHVNYAASKGGVNMMMESIAQEVAGDGIRVNAIAPGAIRTPINRSAWEDEEALEALLEKIPYDRIGEVEDIGKAAVWLASDQSDYVTGETIVVDGGMMLYPGFREGG